MQIHTKVCPSSPIERAGGRRWGVACAAPIALVLLAAAPSPRGSGCATLRAQGGLGPVRLLRDIGVSRNTWSEPEGFVTVGPWSYFAATAIGSTGRELYRTDGTANSASLVVDLVPGTPGSEPESLRAVGGQLAFFATTVGEGTELYFSDGTAAGTRRIDLVPGAGGVTPREGHAVGGRLVFATDASRPGTSGAGLWASDGTSAGTRQLDAALGLSRTTMLSSRAEPGGALGDVAYAVGVDAAGQQVVVVTDGTAAGTATLPVPAGVVVHGTGTSTASGVFVVASTVAGSGGLAVIDPVQRQVRRIPLPGTGLIYRRPVRFGGSVLYGTSRGLLATDGLSAVRVTIGGSGRTGVRILGEAQGSLWVADILTGDVARLAPGATDAVLVGGDPIRSLGDPVGLPGRFVFGSEVGLRAYDLASASVTTLWSSSFRVDQIAEHLGRVLFAGADPVVGEEPHAYEPVGGVSLLGDLSGVARSPGSFPGRFTRLGNATSVVFDARDQETGYEPWITDGTTAGTRRLAELTSGTNAERKNVFVRVGDAVWILVSRGSGIMDVHRTDGTSTTPVLLSSNLSIGAGAFGFGEDLVFAGTSGAVRGVFRLSPSGRLVTVLQTPSFGTSLLDRGDHFLIAHEDPAAGSVFVSASDGSRAVRLASFPGTSGAMTAFRGEVWINGVSRVLAVSDAGVRTTFLPARTRLVATPDDRTLFGRTLGSGQVFATDGTQAGTRYAPSSLAGIVGLVGDRLLLTSQGAIYAWDGRAAAPELLSSDYVDVSVTSSGPDRIFFVAQDAAGTRRIFVSDGTSAGTMPVQPLDVWTGAYFGEPMEVVAGRLFVAAFAPGSGTEPYVVDLGAGVERLGRACVGGLTGTVGLDVDERPRLGANVRVRATSPGAPALAFLVGLPSSAPVRLPGSRCGLVVDLASAALVGFDASGAGATSSTLPIPRAAALVGVRAVVQAVAGPSPGAALGVDLSDAVELRLGR